MACWESSIPSSMLTSIIWAPFSTCCRATSSAASYSPARTSLANLRDPVTLVRSPTFTNSVSGPTVSGSRPLSRSRRQESRRTRGGRSRTASAIARMWCRRRPAAAADQVHQPVLRELAEHGRHLLRRLVVLAEFVGQPGVGVGAHVDRRHPGELLDVLAQSAGAQRTVESDAERPRVGDRVPERLGGLTRQRPPARVGDRARDHHRHPDARALEHLLDGEDAPPWR